MPTLTSLTVQNIEHVLYELTEKWIQQNTHDFPLLKTSMLKKEPIPSIVTELRQQIQVLQQQEEERITRQLQITAIERQKTNDEHEASQDKQEEQNDDVSVIASNIENLRLECAHRMEQKEQIKNRQEKARKEKLDTSVKELINNALLNQIRKDEAQADQEQHDALKDEHLEGNLSAVEQEIAEAKIRVNAKTKAVQDRIQELEKQYQDDPKQLKEKKGKSSLDMFNFGNWKNRDEQLQKLRKNETKAKSKLTELKDKKQHLERAIQTQPTRELERKQNAKARKARNKAKNDALTYDLISIVLDTLLNRESETRFILSPHVERQLSSPNAALLQSNISQARVDLDRECQFNISQALRPIDREISVRDANITQLTKQLKGVAGRAEKRRIQAENRQKRSKLRHQYPKPSTTSSDWDVQLTHGVRQTLSDDIARARNNVEQNAKELLSHAQVQSWPILFDCVSHQRSSHEDNNHINTLQKICAHMKAHQQAHEELKQLACELSTMKRQVGSTQDKIDLLIAQVGSKTKQAEEATLSVTNQQELMPSTQSSVHKCEQKNTKTRRKTMGYAALIAILFIATGVVVAAGVLPMTPIAGVIFMSLFAITTFASVRAYMVWSTASSILVQEKNRLTESLRVIETTNQIIDVLNRQCHDMTRQIKNLQHEIETINPKFDCTQGLIQQKKHDANRSHYLAQAITPENPEPIFQEGSEASAPPIAEVSSLSIFSTTPVVVAVPVTTNDPSSNKTFAYEQT
jgi:hypothetical protein